MLTFELPPDPEAVSAARVALSRLAREVPPRALDDARLIVSELVTNAVRHAPLGPTDVIRLTLKVENGHLRIEVGDPGAGFTWTARTDAAPLGGGWGLYLVSRLADDWGVAVEGGATLVWAEIAAGPAIS